MNPPGPKPSSAFSFITGTANIKHLDWPGGTAGERYALRPLSRSEVFVCAAQAEEYISELGLVGSIANRIVRPDGSVQEITYLDLAVRDEHLARTMRQSPDPTHPLFLNAEEVRNRLSSVEADKHYYRLEAHMAQCAPLTQAEQLGDKGLFEELLELVKKNQEPEMLSVLPPPVLRQLVLYMAGRLIS